MIRLIERYPLAVAWFVEVSWISSIIAILEVFR